MHLLRHGLPLLLLSLCGALYFPGLQGPMLLDDFPQLEGILRNANLGLEQLIDNYLFSNSGPLGRPVAMLTFILDAHVWGSTLWLWKLTSLGLHLATAASFFWFLTLLLRHIPNSEKQKIWLVLFICAIWMLHPLNVSTVLYTVQRMTILSALFAILSMATFLEGRYRIEAHRKSGYVWLLVSIGLFIPLSAFSKENGLLIPLYLVLLEWLFMPQSRWQRVWRTLPETRKRLAGLTVITVGLLTLAALINHYVVGGYASRPFNLGARMLTELRVIAQYLVQIVIPSWNNLGFFHDDIAVSKDLITPPSTLLALFFLAGLIYLGFLLRRLNPVVSFGILFFFATHLMESTIFPLELMFEHRNYLGSMGIIIALTVSAQKYLQASRILPVLALFIMMALATVLLQFSLTWGSKNQLYARLYSSHPDSPSLIAITADHYMVQGKAEQALHLLDRNDRIGYRLHALIIQCQVNRQVEDLALEQLNGRIHSLIQSYELTGLIELSNQLLDQRCHLSEKHYLETLRLALTHTVNGLAKQKLWIYRAHILHKSGNSIQAIHELNAAFMAAPQSPMPLFLATEWLLDKGDKELAKVYYQRALAASDMQSSVTADHVSHFTKRFSP